MYKHILLCVDSNDEEKVGGFMGFNVDVDTIQPTFDKIANKQCFIAYAIHGVNNEGFWITSNTDDMDNCYSICRENSHNVIECNTYGKPVK